MKSKCLLGSATVGMLLLTCSLSTGAVATPAATPVLVKVLNQAEARAKFPAAVQARIRGATLIQTKYSARKTVVHNGQLYVLYSSTFPRVWDEEGINTTCKLACQRDAAKHVLSQSPKLHRALEKFKFGKQVFGEYPSLALLRIARLSFPKFTRFDLKIDKANTAVAVAVVPLQTLEIKSLELAKDSTVLRYYFERLRKTAALYVERQRNYSFAMQLLREARKHGDLSSDLLILLHQVHVAHGNTGEAHDILNEASTKFFANLTAQQCNSLAQHAAAYCDEISASKWQDYAKAKRIKLKPPTPEKK